jgi:hypothetical protein
MRWFREQIRQLTLLALIALAINLALSFGHVHAIPTEHSDASQIALTAAAPLDGDHSRHGDHHPDDLCPICMAAAAMGSAIASTPPVLAVEFAHAVLAPVATTDTVLPQTSRTGFRSRGPPLIS